MSTLNFWRGNQNNLVNYINSQEGARIITDRYSTDDYLHPDMYYSIMEELDYDYLWTCFDHMDKIKNEGKHHSCGHIGMFKHPEIYDWLKDTVQAIRAGSVDLKPLQWSDSLAYSASKMIDRMYGCSVDPDSIAYDGNDHDDLWEIATF